MAHQPNSPIREHAKVVIYGDTAIIRPSISVWWQIKYSGDHAMNILRKFKGYSADIFWLFFFSSNNRSKNSVMLYFIINVRLSF